MSKKIKYQTKTVRVGHFSGQRKVDKLIAKGWEVAHSKGGTLGTVQTVTLRREKR